MTTERSLTQAGIRKRLRVEKIAVEMGIISADQPSIPSGMDDTRLWVADVVDGRGRVDYEILFQHRPDLAQRIEGEFDGTQRSPHASKIDLAVKRQPRSNYSPGGKNHNGIRRGPGRYSGKNDRG